ncbi:peroxidasin homolog pxn-2-like [Dreissena polymorpha]|uniref:Peroxidase n=1 Tax=Dreissena polymorpha TaxID=45954 RepID=A0A9D4RB22_DREPO|nr:peroxidasin homolog pxn-2-like [Dreissena polymorpha]KAH3861659.1 hypothetical protein DPMN_024593 [Dreissena polymorpha]
MRRTLAIVVILAVAALVECKPKEAKRGIRTASQKLRAFMSGLRSRAVADPEERTARRLDVLSKLGFSAEVLRDLKALQMFSRADEDPFCDLKVDCSVDSNRAFVDGQEYRTQSGQCNNLDNYDWGLAGVQHKRLLTNAYDNGKWSARRKSVTGTNRNIVLLPGARKISNAVHATDSDKPLDKASLSSAFIYFLQFISHDITKTPEGDVPTNTDCCNSTNPFCLPIRVEVTDDFFSAGDCYDAQRSFTVLDCDDTSGFQNQINDITAYIDGSMVYGSSDAELKELRSFIGGYLKTSTANFMPEAEDTEDLACDNVEDPDLCFLAGDTRADVHPGLTTFHTVFVREHNRVAAYLGELNADWSDEKIFQETRRIVAAELQRITFNEMLPKVLDSSYVSKYGLSGSYSYNKSVDASVIQEFTFGYRFHNLMPAVFHMAELVGSSVGNTASHEQEDVWQSPGFLLTDNYRGVDHVLLGLVANGCPFINGLMNDASRNFLFVDENGDSFDLASINIERGREWGTPAYYLYRQMCGGVTISAWTDLASTHSADVIADLQSVYASPKDVDLWTGLVTETAVGTSIAGPTMSCLIGMQFANLRNGDRFWYETSDADLKFTTGQLSELKKVTLARVLCDNLDVATMPKDVFSTSGSWVDCSTISGMDLSFWAD